MSQLAKALYDNTAECADELAFRKGDILTVLDQSVAGTSGWWQCSLYGSHGLAPANRLQLLLLPGVTAGPVSHVTRQHTVTQTTTDDSVQDIYQIPSVPRLSSSPTYEFMNRICEAPSAPISASRHLQLRRYRSDGAEGNKSSFLSITPSPRVQVYDVPGPARQTSPLSASSRQMPQKCSLIPNMEPEKSFNSPDSLKCSSLSDSYVYAVPPPLPQEPNYDIPVPSDTQQKRAGGYSTLPNPQKSEWIYDVPAGPEKQSPHPGFYDTMPSTPIYRQPYGSCAQPIQKASPAPSIYDIPKHSPVDNRSPPKELPRVTVCDKQPNRITEQSTTQEESPPPAFSHLLVNHVPLDCRADPNIAHKLKRVRLQRMRNFLAVTTFHDLPGTKESLIQEEDESVRALRVTPDSQRISTASSSSTSSCDSLALSSSSPEPLREVTLCQEEACRRLVDLQESVNRAVPRLMEFVSSHWRRKEHLEKHLKEIKEAAEEIVDSLTRFLNFALDIKGNAYRLTDANLQTRLYKQLSIVEDSGVILQQTVGALAMAGWLLSTLCQDSEQVHAPDQLDRFVMVARTVPEDIKRLVSIINANGKLLFRPPQKDTETLSNTSQTEIKKSPHRSEHSGDSQAAEDDTDYVELQNETEKQQEPQRGTKEAAKPPSIKAQVNNKQHSSESSAKGRLSSVSEHCRLYFGALQKAIGGFVTCLQDGQPPEKFISQSKLVIMVGQRLVDTLCREAQREGSDHSLLCKSNHLCALLKQLAVATKKAALCFPDKQALQEVQQFAKELAQRAQHMRTSLDL
ncbi:cas scaffolding protein family member 4 [Betta splendens]|uniref:Cas scaffolding protein family member 4 n=1 Tax=Betta splendens TaxID=158456 RepID=A0A6P7MMU9_BETSP|nr:cas scaffolding protein family member 4 [Betta splendens]